MSGLVLGGVVLAAGASRRMGTPKAFLTISGRTFLQHAVALLQSASCGQIVVVCPPGTAAPHSTAAGPEIRVVENPRPERGMLSSLRVGLEALGPHVTHAMVTLVDTPLITEETARILAAECLRHPDLVLVPCHQGSPGHPVVWPRECWTPLTEWAGSDGARGFLAANPAMAHRVQVDDAGILRDFDRPQDLPSGG